MNEIEHNLMRTADKIGDLTRSLHALDCVVQRVSQSSDSEITMQLHGHEFIISRKDAYYIVDGLRIVFGNQLANYKSVMKDVLYEEEKQAAQKA